VDDAFRWWTRNRSIVGPTENYMFPDISHARHPAPMPSFIMAVRDDVPWGFLVACHCWIGPFHHGFAGCFPVSGPLVNGWAIESGHGMC
jgi:hypothetical protein